MSDSEPSADIPTTERDTLSEHPVANHGLHCANNNNPVMLRWTGSSYAQTLPSEIRKFLTLGEGYTPKIFIHPEINAVTFAYTNGEEGEQP